MYCVYRPFCNFNISHLPRVVFLKTSPLDDSSAHSASADFEFYDDEVMIISATDRNRGKVLPRNHLLQCARVYYKFTIRNLLDRILKKFETGKNIATSTKSIVNLVKLQSLVVKCCIL